MRCSGTGQSSCSLPVSSLWKPPVVESQGGMSGRQGGSRGGRDVVPEHLCSSKIQSLHGMCFTLYRRLIFCTKEKQVAPLWGCSLSWGLGQKCWACNKACNMACLQQCVPAKSQCRVLWIGPLEKHRGIAKASWQRIMSSSESWH